MQDTLTLQHWANKGRKIRGVADQTFTRRNYRQLPDSDHAPAPFTEEKT
jgi:hypothetical protein